MNQSGKPSFEEEWRRALEEASEAPPPAVWSKIEAHLDDADKNKVVPLLPVWWRSPRLWYAAAAIGALLLVSWPLWESSEKNAQKLPQVATSGSKEKAVDAGTSAEPLAPPVAEPSVSESLAASPSAAQPPLSVSAPKVARADAPRGSQSQTSRSGFVAATRPDKGVKGTFTDEKQPGSIDTQVPLPSEVAPATVTEIALGPSARSAQEPSVDPAGHADAMELAFLSPRAVRELPVHTQKRYVYYRYQVEDDVVPEVTGRKQQLWAGVGLMPASFNPNVQVTSPPSAFTAANAQRQSVSNNSSNAGLSYALQTQAGVKLSKHWSIESGISYLRGNSSFQSSGYVLDAASNRSANVLENAILASASRGSDYYSMAPSSRPLITNEVDVNKLAAFYIDVNQQTRNDYRFVQLPLHAGYTLNPEGKLSYTLLGGMIANVFLRNDLEGASGYTLTNTASDEVYRPLNWAAGTGLRVNYRLSSHWGATLTGAYQRAVSSSLQDNTTLQSRPQLYGLSWGVRYSF